jgi:hypothetical protein
MLASGRAANLIQKKARPGSTPAGLRRHRNDMDSLTTSPAIEAGFTVLREAGVAGTPKREAEALADSILDNEWQALGLNDAELDDAGNQWWAVGAPEALMAAYHEGLRLHARRVLEQRISDLRLRGKVIDDDWTEDFVEEVAAAAELPPEDIVSIVGEFCPIRNHKHALFYAELELRTWHHPGLVHYRFLQRHEAWQGGEFEPWYLELVDESRAFFADADDELADDAAPVPEPEVVRAEASKAAPTNEELDIWRERLALVDGPSTYEARAALQRLTNGMQAIKDGAAGRASKPQPVDLWQRHEAPDLPPGLLPPVIERFAFDHAGIMGADPAGIAMAALGVCGAAINDAIALQVKQHDATWRENARLWVGLVGMPSTKKTPIMNAAMRPLRRLDATMAERNAEAMRQYKALPKAEQACEPEPKQPRHVVEDATIESLQQVLVDSPHGVISIQDELTGWFGAMDKYNPGKGSAADRAFWLKAFNGGHYSVNRVMRGSVLIPNLSIALLGGIQPEPLRKIAGDSVDDGLIQRFLPVVLRPATMGRDVPSGDAVGAYERLVERLVKLSPPKVGNLDGGRAILFSAEAREVRERLEAEHVSLVMALEGVSPKLASHFGKLDGIFARLCLLWHCVEHADGAVPLEVSADVAERVARFMAEFLRPNAIAFYAGLLGMSAGHEDLMALAAFIVSEASAEISARDVQRSTRALRHVTADDARRLCEKLEAFGWLERLEPPTKSSTPRWRVMPEVHTLFAERGRLEAERRAAARAAIAEALKP